MTLREFDAVDFVMDATIDVVQRIHGTNHAAHCEYRPYINDRGLIYCDTCGSQISCLHSDCPEPGPRKLPVRER